MKWLFTDFDGTLKNGVGLEPNPKDIQFVKDFQNKGNKLIIASGRPFDWMKKFCKENYDLIPDFFVANTGGVVADKKEKIYFLNHLEMKVQDQIIATISKFKKDIWLFIYSTGQEEKILFSQPEKCPSYEEKMKLISLENIQKPISEIYDKKLLCIKFLCEPEVFELIKNELIQKGCDLMFVTNLVASSFIYEIHSKTTNKGIGIRKLQEVFKFKDEDVIVAGDDTNDIEMLVEFKNSFLVKQKYNKELEKYATYKINSLWEIEKIL